MTTDIAIIGAGPAGMAAATAAANCGAQVTLVGAEPPGGRAGWHSLLPSKVLLTAADSLGVVERFGTLGLGKATGKPDINALVERIQTLSQAQSDEQAADLAQYGVRFLAGQAAFTGPHRLQVTPNEGAPTTLEADVIIITSGSVPIFPPGLKPDGKRIIAPRFAGKLDHIPASLIVVGGGVTGTEFAYGFNRLGTAVTWIVDEFGVLPSLDREAVDVLGDALAARGVVRREGVAAASAVGAHAADILAPVALGLRLGARLDDLAALFAAHPGLAELTFAAARAR